MPLQLWLEKVSCITATNKSMSLFLHFICNPFSTNHVFVIQSQHLSLCDMELEELLLEHQHNVDIVSYSCYSAVVSSGRKKNARRNTVVAILINSR